MCILLLISLCPLKGSVPYTGEENYPVKQTTEVVIVSPCHDRKLPEIKIAQYSHYTTDRVNIFQLCVCVAFCFRNINLKQYYLVT